MSEFFNSKELPLVTIFALCYNHERFVIDTLTSIFNQTHQNSQIIILDNASSDNSVPIIKEFLGTKINIDKITFIESPVNLGVCGAMNKAIDLAEGEFFQMISCDDILFNEKIEKQLYEFSKYPDSVALIYGNYQCIDEAGKVLDAKSSLDSRGWMDASDLPSGRIKQYVVNDYFLSAPTILYRTRCLRIVGEYDASIPFEDFQMNIRLLDKFSCQGMMDYLCYYRILSNSLYNSSSDMKVEYNYLKTMKYVYGDLYFQNWIIGLRYLLYKNSLKFKVTRRVLFSLLNSVLKDFKKDMLE